MSHCTKAKCLTVLLSILVYNCCSNNNVIASELSNSQIKNNISQTNQHNFDALVKISDKICNTKHLSFSSSRNEMLTYLAQIRLFFQDSEGDILDQLPDIFNKHYYDYDIIDNLRSLIENKLVNNREYEEILRFMFFLHILYALPYANSIYLQSDKIGKQKVRFFKLEDSFGDNTGFIIQELTKLFIPRYVDMTSTTPVNEQDLLTDLMGEIKEMCKSFEYIIKPDNEETSVYDIVPCYIYKHVRGAMFQLLCERLPDEEDE